MTKHIAALAFIFLCVCAAWYILGMTVLTRTGQQESSLNGVVQNLWGGEQRQLAPTITEEADISTDADKANKHTKSIPSSLDGSDIRVNLELEQRKKGLLWYPTYKVGFAGTYKISNNSDSDKSMAIHFDLPDKNGVYDNLKLQVGNKPMQDLRPNGGVINANFAVPAHKSEELKISYDSMGVNSWRYAAGNGLNLVKNFALKMKTNFAAIDFPDGSRSPTSKDKANDGWNLEWHYDNTMTASDIGMAMPKLINPGPLVFDVTFFAPVGLFFFFYVTWLTSTIRSIKLHPMHYFFLGAAFFSFHLLLAYSVDHIAAEWSFLICSIVSVFLVLSYISRVIPDRRFVAQLCVSQFIYLVLFSYTFFLEQFTGLIITCLSIATLFLSMQYTSRVNWTRLFAGKTAEDADLSLIEEAYLPVQNVTTQ